MLACVVREQGHASLLREGLAERSDVVVDPVLVEWLKGRIGRLPSLEVDPVEPADVALFDEFFRRWLGRAWAAAADDGRG